MSVQVRRRREAAGFLATFVGAQGELLIDTTNNRVQVHDGTTPGGFAAAKLSEVVTNTRTAVADANYTVLPADRTIAFTAITAARTVTLPAASVYPTGTQLFILDETGTCSSSNTITVTRAGSDLINGGASTIVASAYGFVAVESNGASRWTIVDQSAGAAASTVTITGGTIDGTPIGGTTAASAKVTTLSATGAATFGGAVTIAGGTIDATPIGATTRSTGAFTTLTVTSSVTLPTNSVTNTSLAQMPALTLKSNVAGAAATPTDSTLSAIIDASQGSTRGAILYRGASGWSVLAPGTSGTVLTANGTGTDPSYQAAGGASSLAVPVRQTVMSGPAASALPSFLPATSASLTLAAQNISVGVPLVLTAAQGFGANGAVNLVYQLTANPSWTLIPGATNYLFVNASSGATSVQTLPPIYQFGGTIATTNGQFTFDYQAMVGYLGNGTAALVTPLVAVGEAAAGASAVTGTIAYSYNGCYDSGFTSTLPATSTITSRSHNLGMNPDAILQSKLTFQCIAADQGYAVGDTLTPVSIQTTGGYVTTGQTLNRATVTVINSTGGWLAFNKSTAGAVGLTVANWKYKFVVMRGW